MQHRPLHDYIIVRRIEAKDQSDGGIIFAQSAKERIDEGIVLAVGPGKLNDAGTFIPTELKVGERVVFNKYTGQSLNTNDGTDTLAMKESEIYGVLED